MKRKMTIGLFLQLTLITQITFAFDIPERRKDQYGKDFAYYFYPIAGEIPGLGSALGAGGSVLNINETDADVTGYYIDGDFKAAGIAALDLQVIPKRLILDVGYNSYQVAATQYKRGLHSSSDDYFQPKAEGGYYIGQLTWTFSERRYEAFIRALTGKERLLEVLDTEGNAFEGIDTDWYHHTSFNIGGSLDLTDDRLDPRRGSRLEFNIKLPQSEPADNTEYLVTDVNATFYLPTRKWDTLVFNIFASHAFVTRKGETDYDTIKAKSGLNCPPTGPDRDSCLKTEDAQIRQIIAHRKYGTASSLGGTQRLRSFSNYRYYASKVFFYGLEYRWNLTDERTPFNIYIAKGIRTGIQLAAFAERGSVSDGYRELIKDGRNSFGIGFRIVLSGVVIRFDGATGDEGFQTQLFITYPWSMFSVDNPS
ncbi:MAG: BamA/TamA family outer membrane protein [Gammaproteobacteria bacterium]|nr:BamA/TamA family outer membrane protein [Gammaproteobacteria bacterium]